MIRSILCAIDMSQPKPDDRPLRVAADLARHHGAQLDVVTVVPDFGAGEVSSFFPEGYQDALRNRTARALAAHVGEVLGDAVNEKVRHEVAVGKVYREVLRVAKEAGSDLIVVGSHAPELHDYLLGSNASRIVRHAPCSVYVVR